MTDNYVDPLPVVQQCQEANAAFNPANMVDPQPPPMYCAEYTVKLKLLFGATLLHDRVVGLLRQWRLLLVQRRRRRVQCPVSI
jgi:hypothetical protein